MFGVQLGSLYIKMWFVGNLRLQSLLYIVCLLFTVIRREMFKKDAYYMFILTR